MPHFQPEKTILVFFFIVPAFSDEDGNFEEFYESSITVEDSQNSIVDVQDPSKVVRVKEWKILRKLQINPMYPNRNNKFLQEREI